jgi:class 3 adenylate cyclase
VSSPPTGIVTFFFTDVQGSTRLWERDAKRMQRALARHDKILKSTVESHSGYVFKMVGDACCAAFSTTPEALEAALSAQRTIFSEPWEEGFGLRVRMAIHTGVAEERRRLFRTCRKPGCQAPFGRSWWTGASLALRPGASP